MKSLYLLVFISTSAGATDSCCAEGETLTADSFCQSDLTTVTSLPALNPTCQGRLHQIGEEMFEMTKFGGQFECPG